MRFAQRRLLLLVPLVLAGALDERFSRAWLLHGGDEHIELIWTEGRHIGPERQVEVQRLLDIVLSRVGG